jgi:tRNA threonylcarbamoyladenosine biosynthesis protein TsaB
MNARGAIIAIDTATPSGSVAMRTAEGALFVRSGNEGEPYSTRLFRWLAEIRFEAGIVEPMPGIAAVAVSSGPGTFTGLRVGVATAKGLALAAGCPVLSFPTLELIARATESPLAVRRPVIAAGRGEVYTALYHVTGEACRQLEEERVIAPAEFSESAEGPVLLTGAGVVLLEGISLPSGSVVDATQAPLAPVLIQRALLRLQQRPAPEGTRVDIRYVREAATTKSGNAA